MICICTCSVVLPEVCARVYYEHVIQPYGQLAVLHSFYLILRWAVGSFIQWFVHLVIKLFFFIWILSIFVVRVIFSMSLGSYPAFLPFLLFEVFRAGFFWPPSDCIRLLWSVAQQLLVCRPQVIRSFFALGQTLPLPKTHLIWILQFTPPHAITQVLNYNLSI